MARHRLLTASQAVDCLRDGKLIAYPTEAVFGLGCDPANEKAVRQLLSLKNRPVAQGLILIADCYERFEPFIASVTPELRDLAMSHWPGPVTWLFPRAKNIPDWLDGNLEIIDLRITEHPVCRELCAEFGGAIVSTSANPGAAEPARSAARVEEYFGSYVCGTVAGALGDNELPSEIRDLVTGAIIRNG
jgi:L-threonylcarbamoyladenylate synthase